MAYMVVRKKSQAGVPAPQKIKESSGVEQSSILGEPGTGYEGPEGGEFECGNCKFFNEDTVSCGQKDMMAKSKRPKIDGGRVVVHPEGCCEYVERIGKKEEDD